MWGSDGGISRVLTRNSICMQRVQAGLAEAQRQAGAAASDKEKAAAKVEVEVYEALQSALSK